MYGIVEFAYLANNRRPETLDLFPLNAFGYLIRPLHSSLGVLLVGLSLVVVGGLVNLVAQSVLGGRGTAKVLVKDSVLRYVRSGSIPSADGGVAVLGNLLVGLLAGTGEGTLDGLRDVVDGLLSGLHCE